MPELPEVETIARSLREGTAEQPSILNYKIEQVKLFWQRTLAEPAPAKLSRLIKGRKITDVGRRGKFLMICLEEVTLLVHLRMSGDLLIRMGDFPPDKHDRLILWLRNSAGETMQLVFNDPRKFGRVWATIDPQRILSTLGPEPLDEALTPAIFYQSLISRKRLLKPLLLDQTFLAGLGNIYTDEVLHLAKLHPLRRSDSLTEGDAQRLLAAIRSILTEGIARNGASIDWVYRGGEFQNHFRVYGREGQPCPECGTPITRLVIGQRGTHVCETCQKNSVDENPREIA
ncbi:MAG: bifunctional DNA-formamidopyrimidine glycosylase/DNA-(apurinic or apyrimidinic site) lyase [Anaerolineaceae bacterium]